MPDDAAVSPILATILMVAITVVVAASVFFISRGFTAHSPEEDPQIGFLQNLNTRELKVIRAEHGVDWNVDLAVGGTCMNLLLNGVAFPPPAGTYVSPGDILSGCESGETLRITTLPNNQLLYHQSFP